MSEPAQGQLETRQAWQQGPHVPLPFRAEGCLPLRHPPRQCGDKHEGPLDGREKHREEKKSPGSRNPWLLGQWFPRLHVLHTGQPSSEHKASSARAVSTALTTFPRSQHGCLPTLCSGASSVASSEGTFPDLLTPSPHPCILPLASRHSYHHLRPHSVVCPRLSCIFPEDSSLACLGMSGPLSLYFPASVPQGPTPPDPQSLSQADLCSSFEEILTDS